MNCKSCGTALKDKGSGVYYCPACFNEYTLDDFEGITKANVISGGVPSGAEIFEKNVNGVLEIVALFNGYGSNGSGYLISERGLAITNTHVVTGKEYEVCKNLTVRIAGEKVSAKVLAIGDDKGGSGDGVDLALIALERVPKYAKVLKFGDFDRVKSGDDVYVIGNSLGDGTCITKGIVSDKLRQFMGKTYLMTDCPINGGNSGGPIFNKYGEVIGTMVASRLNRGAMVEGMNYAIPLPIVNLFIKEVLK